MEELEKYQKDVLTADFKDKFKNLADDFKQLGSAFQSIKNKELEDLWCEVKEDCSRLCSLALEFYNVNDQLYETLMNILDINRGVNKASQICDVIQQHNFDFKDLSTAIMQVYVKMVRIRHGLKKEQGETQVQLNAGYFTAVTSLVSFLTLQSVAYSAFGAFQLQAAIPAFTRSSAKAAFSYQEVQAILKEIQDILDKVEDIENNVKVLREKANKLNNSNLSLAKSIKLSSDDGIDEECLRMKLKGLQETNARLKTEIENLEQNLK
eukprot:CAMPEP_0168564434 /NCGR_PEP_ID=MMETSP0413-20121227/13247_1 /TAXON_ID=136452 /ORGANISM="Filamoeba nolandi, Strain NC-AS-23-1" /LENGTH=265 /DNA_ID=CAMNT_0008596113 /DNA_START=124 /DNA_END=921 /DNA_ORIENTATION=+